LGVFLGIFSDMDVSSRKQRPLLFLFSIILLGFYCAAIIFLNGPKVLLFASLFLAFSLVILNTVNMRIKASIHVATISAFILLFSSIYGTIFLLAAVPLAFIIGWSRVKIKRHTVPEVLMGGFLGITLAIIFYIVSKLFFI
ncbi:MAG: phosphatase PAP2 family protein, partial [Candidatus Levyibacteriota bacterium]